MGLGALDVGFRVLAFRVRVWGSALLLHMLRTPKYVAIVVCTAQTQSTGSRECDEA